MKTLKLILAVGIFSIFCSQSLSAQSQGNRPDPANQSTATQSSYPWTTQKVYYHKNAQGKNLEFHVVSKEQYARYAGNFLYLYVPDLDDCRRQSGDCLQTVVITPDNKN